MFKNVQYSNLTFFILLMIADIVLILRLVLNYSFELKNNE